jgi:hypothetical protein
MRTLLSSWISIWMSIAVPAAALAAEKGADAEARKVAEDYLKATTGEGDEAGKRLLLGGLSMDASLFTLENGRIISKDPVQRESGSLTSAISMMKDLDRTARQALAKVVEADSDGLTVTELDASEAAKVMKPTQDKARKLLKMHPVLGRALRVNKEVYWHPKNPMRPVLAKAGTSGSYALEIHRFVVRSVEGSEKTERKWGLKIVRFKSPGLDTGWKVLPAADWSVE